LSVSRELGATSQDMWRYLIRKCSGKTFKSRSEARDRCRESLVNSPHYMIGPSLAVNRKLWLIRCFAPHRLTRGSKMTLKGAECLLSDVVRFITGWKDARNAIFDATSQVASHVTQFQPCVRLVQLKWKTVPRQCSIWRPSAGYQLLLLLSMQGEEAWDTGAS
jgi:hypothetical protein